MHQEEGPGDLLLFLTGQEEIDSLERLLAERGAALPAGSAGGLRLQVASIYAAMPPEQQMKARPFGSTRSRALALASFRALRRAQRASSRSPAAPSSHQSPLFRACIQVFEPAPPGVRKAVLATNIAETSITIPGVRYVIDAGFVKSRGYHARLGADSLQVVPVSQAQARQRSGRAGREAPGKAFRLFTEAAFGALSPTTPPEIQRSNLGSVVLQLKALGVPDVLAFDFLDPPPRAAVVRSLELLFALGAPRPPARCRLPAAAPAPRSPPAQPWPLQSRP